MTDSVERRTTTDQETGDQTRHYQTQRSVTMGSRPVREPIQVTDPQVADSLNKRTVGIHQLSDIYDLQRLKKQAKLNRNLVAIQQRGLQRAMGEMGLGDQAGDDAMTTDQVLAGNEAEDDHVQIGDTSYNINVGNPEQLDAVMKQLGELQRKQQQVDQQQPPPPEPAQTITTPVGTPIQVNQPADNRELVDAIRALQQQPPQHTQAAPAEPPKKTMAEKIMPWALAAATGLGAAGLTYGLTRPAPGPDADTQYRLEFDNTEDPGMTIPTPRLNE